MLSEMLGEEDAVFVLEALFVGLLVCVPDIDTL